MTNKKTTITENSLIWFGAAVSLAEIITGTAIAPLGFKRGISAVILGHIIGCFLLFLAGIIGGKTKKSSMETVKISFGKRGCLLFAFLNVLQLIGWTAIMIYDGAIAANGIFGIGEWVWVIITGVLISIWIIIGIKNLKAVNIIAMLSLFILTVILSFVIFNRNSFSSPVFDTISFGAAVELSVAMPLSWLPLISDYTKDAEKPFKATLTSAVTYGIVSCWMYFIGIGAAVYAGSSDIADIMLKAGLGTAGLMIIVLSTVTTTYLDVLSAGISSQTLSHKLNGKQTALTVAFIGTIGALLFPLHNITDFLYFIGSVFAPMIAIQIADFFILKNNFEDSSFSLKNISIWLTGFVIYRLLMKVDIIIGSTLPDMIITILLCCIINRNKNQG